MFSEFLVASEKRALSVEDRTANILETISATLNILRSARLKKCVRDSKCVSVRMFVIDYAVSLVFANASKLSLTFFYKIRRRYSREKTAQNFGFVYLSVQIEENNDAHCTTPRGADAGSPSRRASTCA